MVFTVQMFPRKQYTYRSSNGQVDTFATPIRTEWHNNMPRGAFAYPYKSETGGSDIWQDGDIDDVFAIYTLSGWRFFQMDRPEGNIFKMWKFSGTEKFPSGDSTSKQYRAARMAWHIDPNTACGSVFMRERPLSQDDFRCVYTNLNVLPFAQAYFKYEPNSSMNNDIRKYIICDSKDGGHANPWAYTLYLGPHSRLTATATTNSEISTIAKDAPSGISHDYYTTEYATRQIDGPFEDAYTVCNVHTSWGEWIGVKTSKDDKRRYRYFEVDVKTPLNNGMMYVQTDAHMTVYSKFEDTPYKNLLRILDHNPTTKTDTALTTVDGRYLFSTRYDENENKLKVKIGDHITHDDVTVFLFDSCEDDAERKIIMEMLHKKYHSHVDITGSPQIDPILCYIPDLEIMPKDNPTLVALINQCKINHKMD